ncbi:2OG-Fe dioxygenase family protein [Bradyrhizobium ottawaense]|uniref:2OG-Fe dioxygenase family protein n=1 Tax=Bradyrhizobium ottawaense TaxID=931866 RepID=UPI003833272B
MVVARIINEYRERYTGDRYLFIPGREMRDVLVALGAKVDEEAELRSVWDRLPNDPTLNYRQSRNGRFLIDYTDSSVLRLEQRGFRLSSAEDFVRHDSELVRQFAPIMGDLQRNSFTQALIRFKAALIRGMKVRPRPRLKCGDARLVCTAFALRTITDNGLIGEPAAEGVHSDGVEHTLTILISATNLTRESAISTLHFNEEKTGTHTNDAEEKFIAGRVRHSAPLDTLVIVDTEFKHSLTQVTQQCQESRATRDMLILFTRRPCAPEHASFTHDSLQPSDEFPVKFRL